MNIPIYPFIKKVRVTTKWKQKVTQPNGSVNEHNGIDFGTVDLEASGKKADTATYAMYIGEVTDVTDLGTLGWACKVYYKEINETYYYVHLKEVIVKKGQAVKAGQTLGYTGKAPKQTIKIHTHIQSRKGRETGGVYVIRIDSKSNNPEARLNASKLRSEVIPPTPTTPPPPVVTPPNPLEEENKALRLKIQDLEKAGIAKDLMIKDREEEIKALEETERVLEAGLQEHKDRLTATFNLVGLKYADDVANWGDQLEAYRQALANLLKTANAVVLVKALLLKLIKQQ